MGSTALRPSLLSWLGLGLRLSLNLSVRRSAFPRVILTQDWPVVPRRGHPALHRRWTPETYASLDHVVVTLAGRGPSPVDDVLDALARSRRVRLRVPSPLLAPQMALQSDLVVTTARWLAMHLADQDGVVVRRLHERGATDPHQRWFRDRLAAVAAALAPARLRW